MQRNCDPAHIQDPACISNSNWATRRYANLQTANSWTSQLTVAANNSSCKYVRNNQHFERFCRLRFSSRPTYLSFHIQLLAMLQNTHRITVEAASVS